MTRTNETTIEQHLQNIRDRVETAVANVNSVPRMAETRRSDLNRALRYIQFDARQANEQLQELRGTMPARTVDIDRSIEQLNNQAADYMASVEKHDGDLSYVIENGVNAYVADALTELAQALKVCEGTPSNQPYVEETDEDGRTRKSRKLSPEEQVAWRIEQYERTVYDFVARLNSRSTSESSRIREQVEAQAAAELLGFLGGAPETAYAHKLISWTPAFGS